MKTPPSFVLKRNEKTPNKPFNSDTKSSSAQASGAVPGFISAIIDPPRAPLLGGEMYLCSYFQSR